MQWLINIWDDINLKYMHKKYMKANFFTEIFCKTKTNETTTPKRQTKQTKLIQQTKPETNHQVNQPTNKQTTQQKEVKKSYIAWG